MSAAYPVCIASPSGLQVQVHANGSIRRMDCRDILLNLFLGNEIEGGPSNIYLRRHATSIASTPAAWPAQPRYLPSRRAGADGARRVAGHPVHRLVGAGGLRSGMVLARDPGKYGPDCRHRISRSLLRRQRQ
jgi:hypothetical protein